MNSGSLMNDHRVKQSNLGKLLPCRFKFDGEKYFFGLYVKPPLLLGIARIRNRKTSFEKKSFEIFKKDSVYKNSKVITVDKKKK